MTSSNFHDPSACCNDMRLDRESVPRPVEPGPEADIAHLCLATGALEGGAENVCDIGDDDLIALGGQEVMG